MGEKILLQQYQYRFDIYLREQQNFDPNKYVFYDRWFKNQFKIKRIINKEDTTKKYHFIEIIKIVTGNILEEN